MSRLSLLAGAAGLILAAAAGGPVLAQASDPAAQSLIDRLRPQIGGGGQTRGLRVPGEAPPQQDAAPPAMAAPAQPPRTAPPAAGQAGKPPGGAQVAGPGVARPQRETTAEGPAVSITVIFPTGSAMLTPQAEAALSPLGAALNSPDLQPYRFRIEGHTDSVGDAYSNQVLSQRRAAAVRDFLAKRFGVNPARLEAVGFGDTQLLVPTPPQWPEPRNRRVQVVNIGG